MEEGKEAKDCFESEERWVYEKLSRLNHLFELLCPDPKENIDIIVRHTCKILDGIYSFYNRIDHKEKSLYACSVYNVPSDFDRENIPDGHICYEETIKGKDKPVVFGDLEGTIYEETDSNVKKYKLKSYLGFPVRVGGKAIGSLCVVDVKKRNFSQIEINTICTLAKLLSLEEERLQIEEKFRKYQYRFKELVEERAIELKRANEELLRKIAKYEKVEERLKISYELINAMSNFVGIADLEGKLRFVNRKTIDVLGFSEDEVIGIPFWECGWFAKLSENVEKVRRSIDAALQGETRRMEISAFTKDGKEVPIYYTSTPMLDNTGRVMGIALEGMVITELKKKEKALRVSEARYRGLIFKMNEGFGAIDEKGYLTFVNPKLCELTEYTKDELIGMHVLELFDEDNQEILKSELKKRAKGESSRYEITWKTKSGRGVPTLLSASPIFRNGVHKGSYAVITDLSAIKSIEEALRRERKAFHIIADAAIYAADIPDLCYRILSGLVETLDFDFGTVRLYDENKKLLEPVAIIGINEKDMARIVPQHIDDPGCIAAFVARTRKPIFAPNVIRHELQQTHEPRLQYLSIHSIISWPILDVGHEIIGVVQLMGRTPKDITEKDRIFFETVARMFATAIKRKQTEAQIMKSLNEKELLLKEIHHRVKNNLQVISSLLNLQSSYIKDRNYVEVFKESQDRIRSMAYIHEQLYQSNDLANINLNEYINRLVDSLLRSHKVHPERIALKIDVGDVLLGIDKAIPCGLIINELVTNSLKYAFPEEKRGEIRITLRSSEEDGIELMVCDNGIGFEPHLDFRDTDSLGMQLVVMLVKQIGGSIELKRNGGTTFKIKFESS
ncbi:MAG: PAS domain S-box protein [Deltaproteobacteria bacterium]|nr:PAS domain S-box protein [Deltaproteobacteria bacterium]